MAVRLLPCRFATYMFSSGAEISTENWELFEGITDGFNIVDSTVESYDCKNYESISTGLPEAQDKSQPPATSIKWLGITIDSVHGTLSIPQNKLAETLDLIKNRSKRRSISRKQLQSVLGKVMHIAKCICLARLFMSRLLDELRGPYRSFININSSMRSDFKWFIEYASTWNGVALFPRLSPVREIVVDACLDSIGAATKRSAYAHPLSQISDSCQTYRRSRP